MKWRIGALLMALLFCLALLPPLVRTVMTGGLALSGGSGHELIFQEQNTNALLDGKVTPLETGLYRSETDDLMLPAYTLAQLLGLQTSWDSTTQTAQLGDGKTELTIVVGEEKIAGGEETVTVSTPAALTDDILYVPLKGVAQAFSWAYAEDEATASAMICTNQKELKEKDVQKLAEKTIENLGQPCAVLVEDSLVFRAGSDYVVQKGQAADLADQDGKLYAPYVEEQTYYLPAAATACVLGGSAEQTQDGVELTIGETSIELLDGGEVKVNGSKSRAGANDAVEQDGVWYLSSRLLTESIGYFEAGEGDICMIGSKSFAAADSQVAYLTSLGQNLEDKRPDLPVADAYIALTFDDGPTGGADGLTARLLDGLNERGAHATFFMCGYRIKDFHTHMDRYLEEGHELGNHTMDHPGVLTKKDYATILDQIQSNSELITSYCGQGPSVFRPVGGAVNDDVKNAAKEAGLPVVNWSLDTLDWKYRDANSIYDKIVKNAKDGDIVLMHDLRECTLEGVLRAIDTLKEKGFAFVTVDELARVKGVTLEPGEVYTDLHDDTVAKIQNGTYQARYSSQ